jgi:hypothetical protein
VSWTLLNHLVGMGTAESGGFKGRGPNVFDNADEQRVGIGAVLELDLLRAWIANDSAEGLGTGRYGRNPLWRRATDNWLRCWTNEHPCRQHMSTGKTK